MSRGAADKPARVLLQESWTSVSGLYSRELAPRFLPWTQTLLEKLLAGGTLPHGNVVAPCCGPGDELILIAKSCELSGKIIGLDLSDGMVQLATEQIAAAQLLGKAMVLAGWVKAVEPGGVVAVCYWPRQVEAEGPWHTYDQVLHEMLAEQGQPPPPDVDWEQGIPELAAAGGAEVLTDEYVQHNISWPSAEHMWKVMTEGGPWHARGLRYGEQHMRDVRQRFMARYPGVSAPITHRPRARLVVLKRLVSAL